MSITRHLIEHEMLGIGLGQNVKTIGVGGNFADLASAVSAGGDRIVERNNAIGVTTTITNGSPTVTFVGTSYVSLPDATKPRFDDLIQFRDEGRYYKIKSIDSDTQITLYENYVGVTATAVSMKHSWHYLDWMTLLILGGNHNIDGIDIPSGYVITGFGENSNTMSEVSVAKGSPFNAIGEVVFKDLTIAPTPLWGSLDALVRQNQLLSGNEIYWAGQNLVFDSCKLDTRSLDGSHMEGNVSYPFMPNGRTIYKNCKMINDNAAKFLDVYDVGGTPAYAFDNTTTKVILDNCNFTFEWGFGWNKITQKQGLWINDDIELTTLNGSIDSTIDIPFGSVFPSIVGGVYIDAACVVNIRNTPIRNNIPSASQPDHGILVNAGATVNIDNANIESANGAGVIVTNAGAVVNIRGGRVKGSTNSINAGTGTINYDNHVALIGTNTGGTLLDT